MSEFRSHVCFPCRWREASPHVVGLSKCCHPEAEREARHLEDEANGVFTAANLARTMHVRLIPGASVLKPQSDWPWAYTSLIVDHCLAFERKEDAA